MRKVIALFDECQSKENAKHVIRSMKENARQGFWNGATCPLGYRLVGETIGLIYKLYLYGDGTSGALGIKGSSNGSLIGTVIAPAAARPSGSVRCTRS